MRLRILALILLAPLAAVIAVSAALAGTGGGKGRDMPLRRLAGVNFISACAFSHRAPDDPIVFPGRAGASHDHSFVGNRTTNASSTLASLLTDGTTCRNRPADTAGYWMPTLFVGSQAVAPLSATIYYRRKTRRHVQAFPPGLRMIAGDAAATTPQPLRVTFWNCGALVGVPPQSAPPECPAVRGSMLRLHVNFPSCWDGRNLDTANHKSHLAYPVRGRCPSGYAVAVPAISLIYRYPTLGGAGVSLASGGVYSAHADFFNAWNQDALQRLVDDCLNSLRHCARGD
jgi:Domain of unknown function (DUF1996)